jgi:virulence-associated protein VapD
MEFLRHHPQYWKHLIDPRNLTELACLEVQNLMLTSPSDWFCFLCLAGLNYRSIINRDQHEWKTLDLNRASMYSTFGLLMRYNINVDVWCPHADQGIMLIPDGLHYMTHHKIAKARIVSVANNDVTVKMTVLEDAHCFQRTAYADITRDMDEFHFYYPRGSQHLELSRSTQIARILKYPVLGNMHMLVRSDLIIKVGNYERLLALWRCFTIQFDSTIMAVLISYVSQN